MVVIGHNKKKYWAVPPYSGTVKGISGQLLLRSLLFFSLVIACLFLFHQQTYADNITTAKLELFDSVQRTADKKWLHSGAGTASIKIDQIGNRNVRSQFELTATILPTSLGIDSLQSVTRAYGKFRFDSYRGVIGKAPFSWGEGLIFNAADEIFGRGTGKNLMQQEFDDPTAWITSFSKYFGPFSFAEVLVNPGTMGFDLSSENVENIAENSEQPGIEETRIGARFVAKPAGLKFEGGYLFDGRDGIPGVNSLQEGDYFHRLYMSLQGNLWLDWHLSSSLEIPDPDHAPDEFQDLLWAGQLYTAGLYSIIPVAYDDTLSFRVEVRLYPAGEWSESHDLSQPPYALYKYSELSYEFGGGFGLLARALVNPIDLSARLSPGFSWNLFQGFTLLGFATVQTGEPLDSYAWEAENLDGTPLRESPGLALQAGCSITY